jgi:hypothetical protein
MLKQLIHLLVRCNTGQPEVSFIAQAVPKGASTGVQKAESLIGAAFTAMLPCQQAHSAIQPASAQRRDWQNNLGGAI